MSRGLLPILRIRFVLVAVWIWVSPEFVAAGPVPWSNSSGSGSFFDWTAGGSDNNRFGEPTLVDGNKFVFSPPSFEAVSINGNPALLGDRLELKLTVHNGFRFTRIEVYESGEYRFEGAGDTLVGGTVYGVDLDQYRLKKQEWTFHANNSETSGDPSSPNSVVTGDWAGMYFIDFCGTTPDWHYMQIVLNDNVLATSQPVSKSSIKKKKVTIVVTPEPAALLLFVLGGATFFRRRGSSPLPAEE